VLAHSCDNPLCQNPGCWRESDPYANARDYAKRRHTVRGALTDTRGARGRAAPSGTPLATARDGADVQEAVLAGWRPVHRQSPWIGSANASLIVA